MSTASLTVRTPVTPDLLRGAIEVESTPLGVIAHRLPAWARRQYPDAQLAMAESQPSGVRLVFQTTARHIELVALPTKRSYGNLPARPAGVYDLHIDGRPFAQASALGGRVMSIDMATGTASMTDGEPQTLRFAGLPAGLKTIEIWLPHDETTELLALRSDAAVSAVEKSAKPTWLHHGSSISQGSNAAHPSGIWPAVAAMRAGVDLVNLGFGGNALLDSFVARTIRDTPADLISIKIGINLVNTDLMRLRAFGPAMHGVLDTIREGHPVTPLLVVSPVFCPIHETVPGPTLFDTAALAEGRLLFRASGTASEVRQGKLTLQVIREQLRAIVKQRAEHDANLRYLDGTELYGADDNARLPLPDQLHPDADAHQLMGERFSSLAFAGGLFDDRVTQL
jgi:lysophospholipase L1-like esterase